jgi:hypothetical protein
MHYNGTEINTNIQYQYLHAHTRVYVLKFANLFQSRNKIKLRHLCKFIKIIFSKARPPGGSFNYANILKNIGQQFHQYKKTNNLLSPQPM